MPTAARPQSVIAYFSADHEMGYRQPATGRWQLWPLPATHRAVPLGELGPTDGKEQLSIAARPWGLFVTAEEPVSVLLEDDEAPSRRGRRVRLPFGAVARVGSVVLAPLDPYQLEAARLGNRPLHVIDEAPLHGGRSPRISRPLQPLLAALAALAAVVVLAALGLWTLGSHRSLHGARDDEPRWGLAVGPGVCVGGPCSPEDAVHWQLSPDWVFHHLHHPHCLRWSASDDELSAASQMPPHLTEQKKRI